MSATRPSLTRHARLDVAMRLINRHENFVGIILAKAGKINQQVMFVGHGELNVFYFGRVIENVLRHCVKSMLDGFTLVPGKSRQKKVANLRAKFGEGGVLTVVRPVSAHGGA